MNGKLQVLKGKTWPRGTSSRLPFAVNGALLFVDKPRPFTIQTFSCYDILYSLYNLPHEEET